ncbi:gas vesicle protein [Streptomyces sp. RS10V-4]|uniref:gas vesicle protein n=1 Tax=Streptomyces rhizoryzae TaxID=2932493 RepID=UPI0020046564|nr:gas vesicle protein [Streptomyces rhizoryzae]MCK7625862.1 gas vesicle protein [Streptomyces rhizoryzae]
MTARPPGGAAGPRPAPGSPLPDTSGITDLFGEEALAGRQVALIDLLDRLLNGGAVLTGDLVLSVADVDLVRINLRAVIHAITPDDPAPW